MHTHTRAKHISRKSTTRDRKVEGSGGDSSARRRNRRISLVACT